MKTSKSIYIVFIVIGGISMRHLTIVFMQKDEKHCLFLLRKISFIFSLPQNPDIRQDYEKFIGVYQM